MFLRQLISSVGGKAFGNYSKIHLESTKFENQCIKIGCKNYTFTFCDFFWNFKVVKKVLKIKGQLTNYVICFLLFCFIVKIFLRKMPKLVNISIAGIVYLLKFGTHFSTFLKYMFWQIKYPCGSRFNEFSQNTFVHSDLPLYTSALRIL